MKHTVTIEGREKLIPCEDYQLINLLSNIQDRLDIDDEDVAESINDHRMKNKLIWARRVNERNIQKFKRGDRIETSHQMQITNFIIRNIKKGDLEVNNGIRANNQRRRPNETLGHKQKSFKSLASRKRSAIYKCRPWQKSLFG